MGILQLENQVVGLQVENRVVGLQVKLWREEMFQADFQVLLPVEKVFWNLDLFLKRAARRQMRHWEEGRPKRSPSQLR